MLREVLQENSETTPKIFTKIHTKTSCQDSYQDSSEIFQNYRTHKSWYHIFAPSCILLSLILFINIDNHVVLVLLGVVLRVVTPSVDQRAGGNGVRDVPRVQTLPAAVVQREDPAGGDV